MTSRIIVAIVAIAAAVLSLAAPVDVAAQVSFTLTDSSFGRTQATATGLTPGHVYYMGETNGAIRLGCGVERAADASGTLVITYRGGWGAGQQQGPWEWHLFADPHPPLDSEGEGDNLCRNPVPGGIVSIPLDTRRQVPKLIARDVTETSATLALEGPYSSHKMDRWAYRVRWDSLQGYYSPYRDQAAACTLGATPTPEIHGAPNPYLSGLEPGTTYEVHLYGRPRFTTDEQGAWPDFEGVEFECSIELTTVLSLGIGPPHKRFRFTTKGVSAPAPAAPAGVEATTDGSGGVTLSWEHPGTSDPVEEPARYEYRLRRAGQQVGDWTTVPGSNADTTSVTIDLTTGAVVAVNNATPPMVEWTIYLRARNADGTPGRYTETVVTAGPETVVPALPLAGLVTLALVLFLGGQRQRKRGG